MAENLRTTKYNDGTTIPNVTDNTEWHNQSMGAYCNYNNSSDVIIIATYGRLYNWIAVNTRKLAPIGWHVPSDAEWTKLTDFLGESIAAEKLKESGTKHWTNNSTGVTNETGFTALPGGTRIIDGTFDGIGVYSIWWSSSKTPYYNDKDAWIRLMDDVGPDVWNFYSFYQQGNYVRCVKN